MVHAKYTSGRIRLGASAPRAVVPHGAQLGLLRPIASATSLAPSRDLLSGDAIVLWPWPAGAKWVPCGFAVLPLPSE